MALEFKTDALGNNAVVKEAIVEAITVSETLGLGDSGTVFLVGTDALVVTLPATIANAAADSVSGSVADKDIINTKATANKGDRITLIGDGVDGWYIVEGVGIWASEA